MKKFKKLVLILPVIAAMLLASIPVAADYSAYCWGGDNVGMNSKYEWSISIYNGSGYAYGRFSNGNGMVNAFLNAYFYGTISNTQEFTCEIWADSGYQITSGGVNFYDA